MQDTLETLETQMPGAPEALLGAWQHAEHVATSTQHLTDALTPLYAQCTHSTTALVAALSELQTAATSAVPQHLASRIASLGQHLEALRTRVSAGQAALATAAQHVQDKVMAFQERQQQARERLDQAAVAAQQALTATQEKIHAAEQQALAAFGVAQEAITAFHTQVDQAGSETAAHVDTLHQELQQAQDTVAGKVQATVTSGFSQPQEAFVRLLERLNQERIGVPVQQLLSATQTTVEQQLRQVLDDAVLSQLSGMVRTVEQQIRQARQSSSGERQLLEPLIHELERVLDPVQEALNQVQNIAASVGVSL